MKYKYDGYIETLATRFKGNLDEIAAVHNFSLGEEFEIAICKTLRAALPEQFGICRGFVVTSEGEAAGDDIIIYQRDRFPVLRLINDENYSQKQQIPVEAVFAYIEAKHTLILDGKGPQSLHKAANQVATVKALPRRPVTIKNAFHPYIDFSNLKAPVRANFPQQLNPLFGAIVARHIQVKESSNQLESGSEIRQALHGKSIESEPATDLIIAGEDVVLLPFIIDDSSQPDKMTYHSPFFIEEKSTLQCWEKPGLAFAIGICSLFYALDTIILGHISWPVMIAHSLGLPTS